MKFKMKKFGVAFVAAILATTAMAASTETGVLTVNATVAGACAVGDAAMAFAVSPAVNTNGSGSQTSSAVPSSTTVNVICTSGQSGTLSAGQGAHYDTTGAARRLSDLATTPTYVAYELYTDTGYSTVFDTTNTISVTGTGTSAPVSIYGRIAAVDAAAAPKGSYSDAVTLTISYTP
jgi:spore coat protein U-like protein